LFSSEEYKGQMEILKVHLYLLVLALNQAAYFKISVTFFRRNILESGAATVIHNVAADFIH